MNFQTAAAVGGVVFGLSFIAGLFGGVPFFDIVWRALIWGAVGFGGSVGIEMVLKSLVPDLFVPRVEEPESTPERNVDITLDEERPSGFVEEEGEAAAPAHRAEAPDSAVETAPSEPAKAPAEGEEDMPEIGSFLDAFKPQGAATEGEGETGAQASSPDYGDYAPSERSSSGSSGVTIDGEEQDPAILAKAIQTVLKRDAQGS
jgi:hypothetical protein